MNIMPGMRMENRKTRVLKNSSGFTLLEIILVLLIVGILSAIVVPKMTGLITNMRLKAAGEKIMDDLRYIYSYAVTHRDTTWLVVNVNDNSYGIYSGPSSSQRQLLLDPSTNQKALIDLDVAYPGVFISAVNFGGSNEVYFDWWGTPSNGGKIVLNNSKTILVTPNTGYVYESK